MKKIILCFVCLFNLIAHAHILNYDHQILKQWNFTKDQRMVEASFSMMKNGKVYLEDAQNHSICIPFKNLCKKDQTYVLKRVAQIQALNTPRVSRLQENQSNVIKLFMILLILVVLTIGTYKKVSAAKAKYFYPIFGLGALFSLYSFSKKMNTITDPAFVNAAFTPFIPNVATSWDNTYFYVESKGIPNHTMMVGISNHGWQQQVPIPQCYIGTNHWSIPLNPVVASTPIAIDNVHFTRGAIAIAANGVPIFNYHTNTGVDSYLDGQLDNYGGHCGRGDDYHYHIAPLHLYSLGQTTTNLPCAFSLDGYAVYGSVEPDGSPMATLDTNHGHYGTNGIYHYHGTMTAPYMIGNFVGQVTEDATYQLIPQAAAHPVRNENWTPLSGALITSCTPNTPNTGYTVSYTLNGTPGYATQFGWNGSTYTFNYITPSGTTTTNYNGFTQCTVPVLTNDVFVLDQQISVYPNPAHDTIFIAYQDKDMAQNVQTISIYNIKGALVYKSLSAKTELEVRSLASGTYFIKFQFSDVEVTKKIIVR